MYDLHQKYKNKNLRMSQVLLACACNPQEAEIRKITV
jgi:hypothetical protein